MYYSFSSFSLGKIGWFGWFKLYRMRLPLANPSARRNSLGAITADACQTSRKTVILLCISWLAIPADILGNCLASGPRHKACYSENCTQKAVHVSGSSCLVPLPSF